MGTATVSDVVQKAALLLTVLGLLFGCLVLVRKRDIGRGVTVLLEFLLAAGLLRLPDNPTYRTITTAAVVILVRKVLTCGARRPQGRRRRPEDASPGRPLTGCG